jgi:hypothetical protein
MASPNSALSQTAIKGTSIQTPTSSLENHTAVLKQLKEVAEIGQRLRGSVGDSFVRVSELLNTGVARVVNGTIQPQNTVTGSPATVAPDGGPTGTGLVGSTGTYGGGGVTLSLLDIPTLTVVGNNSGASGAPYALGASDLMQIILSGMMSIASLRL